MSHEITGDICRKYGNFKIIKFTRSCKAGESEVWKHLVAVLLNVTGN